MLVAVDKEDGETLVAVNKEDGPLEVNKGGRRDVSGPSVETAPVTRLRR